jgi:NADPH:quinone reductase-like Zn-dependent oxidoreductase
MPHILRSVALLGVDSVMAPQARRDRAWATLAASLDRAHLARIARVEPMSKLPELAAEIIAGRIRGRVVVDVTA